MPLLSRRQFPPGGFLFFEARTNWSSTPGFTFDQTVEEIIRHRLANPRFASQWNTDVDTVAEELDAYTCVRIAMDSNYCSGGSPNFPSVPLTPRPWPGLPSVGAVAGGVRKVVTGIAVLLDWLGAGGKPVAPERAEARAALCDGCPQNTQGNLTDFFTVPTSEMIRKQLAIRTDLKLSTTHDDWLHVCMACFCPMKLKVHTPLQHILKHLQPDQRAKLDSRCWIPKEEAHENPLPAPGGQPPPV